MVNRIEVVLNQSVEEEMLLRLNKEKLATRYSRIGNVHGSGSNGSRLSTNVWPEENCIYLFYVCDDYARKITEIIRQLKEHYPDEGIKCWISKADEVF